MSNMTTEFEFCDAYDTVTVRDGESACMVDFNHAGEQTQVIFFFDGDECDAPDDADRYIEAAHAAYAERFEAGEDIDCDYDRDDYFCSAADMWNVA